MANASATKGRRTRRKPPAKRSAGRGRTWPWLAALCLAVGGIYAYEHSDQLRRWVPASVSDAHNLASVEEAIRQSPQIRHSPAPEVETAAHPVPKPPVAEVKPVADELKGKGFTGTFYFCGTSGLDNCVASGDQFWFRKQAIQLADIDAPQTENARCQAERDKGFAAKVRLRDLLNAGAFELVDWPNRSENERGRKLRVVMRNGQSVGAQLIREGLVHGVADGRKPWC